MTPLGDPDGVGHRLGKVAEHGRHLLGGLQVELVAVVAQPVGVGDRLASADAQQDIVRPVVGILQVVDVVGADERQVEISRDRCEARVHHPLFVDALVLHLEEEIASPENVAVGRRRLPRFRLLFRANAGRDLSLEAAAEPDEAGGMRREQVLVDPGLVIEPFGVSRRDELDEVVIPLAGLGEEDEVVRRLPRRTAFRSTIARRDVDLAAENRVDAPLPRLVVKDDRREHVAVLGDGERRHVQLNRAVEQLFDAAGAVEERVLRVQMQMDELGHYSHSIVDGGFELMSKTTRLMPLTSLTMRDEMVASSSCGSRAQSAVIPSRLSTARIAIVYS